MNWDLWVPGLGHNEEHSSAPQAITAMELGAQERAKLEGSAFCGQSPALVDRAWLEVSMTLEFNKPVRVDQ